MLQMTKSWISDLFVIEFYFCDDVSRESRLTSHKMLIEFTIDIPKPKLRNTITQNWKISEIFEPLDEFHF